MLLKIDIEELEGEMHNFQPYSRVLSCISNDQQFTKILGYLRQAPYSYKAKKKSGTGIQRLIVEGKK